MGAVEQPSSPLEMSTTATQWLRLLRERRVGAVELLEMHLQQVEKHNDALNLVVARDAETAVAAARRADNRGASERLPLQGLPMTVKDTFEVTGMPATGGFSFLAAHVPDRDAAAVARLKAAGAVVFGKTNVPPGAFDWQSFNPHYGVSNNPWDLTRTPGGSSGGSAGAVAAGFAPLELGSDIGGSIRVPAHFCGVYGHKPSHGIVPIEGHVPPLPGQRIEYEMGVAGPLARSAHDLELALDVLTAPGTLDRSAWTVNLPGSRHEQLRDFRVAVWLDEAYAVDQRYREAIDAYLIDLRDLGVQADPMGRPDIDVHASYETFLNVLFSVAGTGLAEAAKQAVFDAAAVLPTGSDNYVSRFARILNRTHVEYLATEEHRAVLRWAWHEFFTRYDVLLAPVFPTVAYPHDHRGIELSDPVSAGQSRTLPVSGEELPYFDGLQWSSLALVADLPATAIPTGKFVDGLPAGVQIIAPYLEDRTGLRFAQLVEDALGVVGIAPAYA